jgi:uncharacterized membrane protein YdfJ with MMPL/SSD domain
MTLRRRLALTGLVGVALGVALTGGAVWFLGQPGWFPLITNRYGIWLFAGFVLLFSLAEIPLMVFSLRQMVSSPSGERLAVWITAAFVFFATFYAAPFTVLTGRVGAGVALAALCLLRLVSALLFVPGARPTLAD